MSRFLAEIAFFSVVLIFMNNFVFFTITELFSKNISIIGHIRKKCSKMESLGKKRHLNKAHHNECYSFFSMKPYFCSHDNLSHYFVTVCNATHTLTWKKWRKL